MICSWRGREDNVSFPVSGSRESCLSCLRMYALVILVPRAHDPSGLWQGSIESSSLRSLEVKAIWTRTHNAALGKRETGHDKKHQSRSLNRQATQATRALAWSNIGSPRFTDFPSNLANLIGWEYKTNTLCILWKSGPAIQAGRIVGSGYRNGAYLFVVKKINFFYVD